MSSSGRGSPCFLQLPRLVLHHLRSRRSLAGLVVAAAAVTAAGCSDEDGAGQSDTDGYARGEDLPSSAIGDPSLGEQVFEEKHCADCHAYDGTGGADAPPLDFMKDRLSATEIANMAGTIWNHLPQMLVYFEEEGTPVPTFSDDEMANLVAYLHGGPAGDGTTGAPAGHVGGGNLSSSAIGDLVNGERLFEQKRCSDCHSYGGSGGSDAPPLDSMLGHLSATELANMAGTVWNHLPGMLTYFEEEGIPVPTFSDNEMADLVAYLHGGPMR